MPETDFNYFATIISIISIIIAVTTCCLSYVSIKRSTRPYLYLYLISSKNATYVKIKNFGKSQGIITKFDSDVDLAEYKTDNIHPFPYVGLTEITVVPNASKIAKIDNKYLNSNHWISVEYRMNRWFTYKHKIQLNTYREYAIVSDKDFDLIDY